MNDKIKTILFILVALIVSIGSTIKSLPWGDFFIIFYLPFAFTIIMLGFIIYLIFYRK